MVNDHFILPTQNYKALYKDSFCLQCALIILE